jgi:hypothetical protein
MEEGCCKQMHERHIEFAYRNRRMVAVFYSRDPLYGGRIYSLW